MASAIYISHMPEDIGLASKIQAQLHDHQFTRDLNSPNIKIAFFILNCGYLYDTTAESTVLALLNRPGVWCIPLFYHLYSHDVGNMCRTPQAKDHPFWHRLKELKGVEYNRGDEAQFVQQIANTIRSGPRGTARYDVFLSHAGEVKPFCEKVRVQLEQSGISAFLDKHDITGGPGALPFSEEIRGAIEGSKVVVAVLSHHFASKHWPVQEIVELCRRGGAARALPVFYHVSKVQCEEIVHHARTVHGRDALAWLFSQPGIEHFGNYAGNQLSEERLLQSIVHNVSSMLGR